MENYTYWNRNKTAFYNRLDAFLQSTNQHLDIYETNPYYAIFSAFDYWIKNNEEAKPFNHLGALDYWLDKNKNNEMYFGQKYETIMDSEYIQSIINQESEKRKLIFDDKFESDLVAFIKKYEQDKKVNIYTGIESWDDIRGGIKKLMYQGLELYEAVYDYLDNNPVLHREQTENINIVKKVCKELGVSQKELSEMLDVPQGTMSRWQNGEIPKMANIALELMLENEQYKKGTEALNTAFRLLNIQK